MGLGLIVALAFCLLVVAGVMYYFYVAAQGPDQSDLPVQTPPAYAAAMPPPPPPPQPVYLPPVYSTAPPPPPQPVYYAPAPQPYALNQVVYTQEPGYAPAPGYAPNHGTPANGGYENDQRGGGVSGASVAMGAAVGLAGGLVVGGLIAEASHANDYYDDDDEARDVYAGDF